MTLVISFFVNRPTTTTLPLKVCSSVKAGVPPHVNALCTVMLVAVLTAWWPGPDSADPGGAQAGAAREDGQTKTIVLTGGGTAGHVTPHPGPAARLQDAGYTVHYIGTYQGMEREMVGRPAGGQLSSHPHGQAAPLF